MKNRRYPAVDIVKLVVEHGGIKEVHTERTPIFDRRTGAKIHAWMNRIICKDGWVRWVTTREEVKLKDLPEEFKAERHYVDGQLTSFEE